MDVIKSTKEARRDHIKSVVLVLNHHVDAPCVGSGFVIDRFKTKCLVMTCQHILTPRGNISIRLSGSSMPYDATVLYENQELDLAILRVHLSEDEKGPPPLKFRDAAEDIPSGSLVFLAAHYLPNVLEGCKTAACLYPTVMPGKIASKLEVHRNNNAICAVIHTCSSQGGCSGGALIHESEVIGIDVSSVQQFELARSVESVKSVVRQWMQIPDHFALTTQQLVDILASDDRGYQDNDEDRDVDEDSDSHVDVVSLGKRRGRRGRKKKRRRN